MPALNALHKPEILIRLKRASCMEAAMDDNRRDRLHTHCPALEVQIQIRKTAKDQAFSVGVESGPIGKALMQRSIPKLRQTNNITMGPCPN